MTEVELESQHPILFIYDVENRDMVIPPYQAGELVAHNDTCVSVGTRILAQGPTLVRLAQSAMAPIGQLVFSGTIRAPSRSVGVNTSESEGLLSIETRDDVARIRVWADDSREPSIVTIEVK